MAIRVTLSGYSPRSSGAASASRWASEGPHGNVWGNSGKSFPQTALGICLKSVMPTLGPPHKPLSNVLLTTYMPCQKLVKATDVGYSGSAIALDQMPKGVVMAVA